MLDEEAVDTISFLELLVGSLFDDPTLGYDCNYVGIFDCAQAMSNDKNSSIFADLIQSIL